MKDSQSRFAGSHLVAKFPHINPRPVRVQHQQLDVRQHGAELLGGIAIVGLEYSVVAHPQETRDREQ
jgi:hypothetical protein